MTGNNLGGVEMRKGDEDDVEEQHWWRIIDDVKRRER